MKPKPKTESVPKNALSTLDSHNTKAEQFAKWIYGEVKGGQIVTMEQCMRFLCALSDLDPKIGMSEYEIRQWVSKAKKYLVMHLNIILLPIPKMGWRMAIGTEKGEYVAKMYHIASQYMKWVNSIGSTLSDEEISQDFKPALLKYQKQVLLTQQTREEFSEAYQKHKAIKKVESKIVREKQKFIS